MSLTLGPYRLHSELGRGGMGVVWRGEHPSYGSVAVKLMTAEGLRTPGAVAAFRNEVRAMAGMDHPNIARVLDAGVIPESASAELPKGAPFLVQTLAEGGTLEQHAPYTWGQLRGVLREILAALAHAHARGVVHLDLKPANVLLDSEAHALLADFGIAHAMGDSQLALAGGTPQYMAPEQFESRARDLGPWTDLYSLGCMVWRLVTRVPMWPKLTGAALAYAHHARTPGEFVPAFEVPAGFEAWLRRLLVSEPSQRWSFAADALYALNHLPQLHSTEPMERVQGHTSPTWQSRGQSQPIPALDRGALSLFGMRRMRLVGRDAERDQLWTALASVTETRNPQVLLLRGPLGCGKSRLAEWFTARAHELGAAATATVRLGEGAGSSRGLGDLVLELTQAHGLGRVETRERLVDVLGVVEVGRVVALTDCIHLQPGASAAGSKWRARRAAATWLLGERSRERPLVVWLDDVNGSPEVVSLLGECLRSESQLPVLFVATVDEGAGCTSLAELHALDRCAAIELGALGEPEHAALVSQLIRLERGLERELCRRTQGSPMFAVEIVRDLVQRGALAHGPRGFVLADGVTLELPDDLYAVWDRRVSALVDGLPHEASLALAIAAALGPRIAVARWHEACRLAALGAPWLIEEALASGRLIAMEAAAVPAWRFVHGGLHAVVVRWAKDRGLWAAANQACAAMLEVLDEAGSEEGRARHLAEAGEHGRAAPLLLRAAVLRYSRGDREPLHALVALRETSLTALGIARSDAAWGEGWMLRARVYAGDGRIDEALELLDHIDAHSGQPGWEWLGSRSTITRAYAALRTDLVQSRKLYEVGIESCEAVGDKLGLARAHNGLAFITRASGQFEQARAHALETLRLYERVDRGSGVADALLTLGDIARTTGDLAEAKRCYQASLDVPGLEANLSGRAECVSGLGEVARLAGDLDEAEALYAEAERLQSVMGADASAIQCNRAMILLERGSFDDARALIDALRARWAPHPLSQITAAVCLMALCCHAEDQDWGAWGRDLAAFESIAAETALVDPDFAIVAEMAAQAAERQGQSERAADARAIADAQNAALASGA